MRIMFHGLFELLASTDLYDYETYTQIFLRVIFKLVYREKNIDK